MQLISYNGILRKRYDKKIYNLTFSDPSPTYRNLIDISKIVCNSINTNTYKVLYEFSIKKEKNNSFYLIHTCEAENIASGNYFIYVILRYGSRAKTKLTFKDEKIRNINYNRVKTCDYIDLKINIDGTITLLPRYFCKKSINQILSNIFLKNW